jgi:hypothetical protein
MCSRSGLCSGFELTDQACPWCGHITRPCLWVEVIRNNTVKAVTQVSQQRSPLKTRYDPSSTISFAQNSTLAIYIARPKGKASYICNFESVNNMSDSLFWERIINQNQKEITLDALPLLIRCLKFRFGLIKDHLKTIIYLMFSLMTKLKTKSFMETKRPMCFCEAHGCN